MPEADKAPAHPPPDSDRTGLRLLALSDIHGRRAAVERLTEVEHGRFDAVVVAGDIVEKRAAARDILLPLVRYGCPVLYVYGNWDWRLSYDEDLGIGQHLHGRAVAVGGWTFVGFSGCDANWGANPIAARLRPEDPAHGRIMRENVAAMAAAWAASGAPAAHTVVVTHQRCHRLHEIMPGTALHLFGHTHGFKATSYQGIAYVNVSVMAPVPRPGKPPPRHTGNYTVIELREDGIEARPMPL